MSKFETKENIQESLSAIILSLQGILNDVLNAPDSEEHILLKNEIVDKLIGLSDKFLSEIMQTVVRLIRLGETEFEIHLLEMTRTNLADCSLDRFGLRELFCMSVMIQWQAECARLGYSECRRFVKSFVYKKRREFFIEIKLSKCQYNY